MSITLSSQLRITAAHTLTNALDLSSGVEAFSQTITQSLTNGTGANQGNMAWSDSFTISDGQSQTIDLQNLICAFGGMKFTEVKMFAVWTTNTSSGTTWSLGAGDSNGWTNWSDNNTSPIKASGSSLLLFSAPVSGWTVASNNKTLKITNNHQSASLTVNVWVLGVGTML